MVKHKRLETYSIEIILSHIRDRHIFYYAYITACHTIGNEESKKMATRSAISGILFYINIKHSRLRTCVISTFVDDQINTIIIIYLNSNIVLLFVYLLRVRNVLRRR